MRSRGIYALAAAIIVSLLWTACADSTEKEGKSTSNIGDLEKGEGKFHSADSTRLLQVSNTIVELLANEDYKELAGYIPEDEGLLISPYTYIDSSTVQLSREEFLSALDSNKIFLWGLTDGKGDSIRMNIDSYFDRFVYDTNFAKADTVSLNEFVGTGNTINNILDTLPNTDFVEYHFFGSETYSGMDWKSLILVFKRNKQHYFLRAIVHNEWTI